jgi:hypothetical protein
MIFVVTIKDVIGLVIFGSLLIYFLYACLTAVFSKRRPRK